MEEAYPHPETVYCHHGLYQMKCFHQVTSLCSALGPTVEFWDCLVVRMIFYWTARMRIDARLIFLLSVHGNNWFQERGIASDLFLTPLYGDHCGFSTDYHVWMWFKWGIQFRVSDCLLQKHQVALNH